MTIDWTKYLYYQEKDGYCGVAVIQMILARAGIEKTQKEIAKDVYLEFWGVSRQIMLAYLSLYFKVVNYRDNSKTGDISLHLKKDHAIVVNWWDEGEDGSGDGHYSIVSNYNPVKRILTLLDPSGERSGFWDIKYSDFEHKWWDSLVIDNKIWSTGWMLWVDFKSKR
jgi:hypothetical protein